MTEELEEKLNRENVIVILNKYERELKEKGDYEIAKRVKERKQEIRKQKYV